MNIKDIESDINYIKNKYKVYIALLTQTGTSEISHTILENTIGLVLTGGRQGAGLHPQYITNASLTPSGKTFVLISGEGASNKVFFNAKHLIIGENHFIDIQVTDHTGTGRDAFDAYLEIRVYP